MTRPQHPFTVRHRDVFAIAVPAAVAFVTEPLAGITDTTVIGRLGDPALLAGLALGTTVFSILFALAFFLRFGTAGLTAQSVGARDPQDGLIHLVRALGVALVLGLAIVALQGPLHALFVYLLAPPPNAQPAFAAYLFTRLWSVPFVFVNFVLLGWFYGRARARTGMALQILIHCVNIALSVALVFGLGLGVFGVALATVAGQVAAAFLGLVLVLGHYGGFGAMMRPLSRAQVLDADGLKRMVSISRDLIIRSLALITAFAYFSAQAARLGEVTLAANAILLQLFAIAAFFLDGLATASEQLSGKAVGANWPPAFERARRLGLGWGLAIAAALSLALFGLGGLVIDLMTTSEAVRASARTYLFAVALTPVTGMPAFIYDGIMIGATLNATMRNGMLASLALYLSSALLLQPLFGLAGLWLAFHILLLARAGIYAVAIRRRGAALFSQPAGSA